MKLDRSYVLAAASATVIALSATGAQAGAFGLRTQSTVALGQAWAGNAAGAAGLSSAFWNPATITMKPGYNGDYNVSFVDAHANIRVLPPTPTIGAGNSGDIPQFAVVPATYSAYQINDNVWVGLASAAPFGSITKPNTIWAGQTYSRSSRITSLSFTPILAVKVTDWLSIGAGPIVEYFRVRLNQATGVAPTAGNIILEGYDWSAGVSAGATVTPLPGTTLGLGYRSTIRHDVTGTFRTPLAVLPVRINVNLPDQLTFSATQVITPDFRLSGTFEWLNWSRLQTPAIVLQATGTPVAPFPLRYKDGYLFSVGGEYRLTPEWELRAGTGYEISPIDNSNRSTRLPDTDRVFATVGASYQFTDKLKINGSYARYFSVGNRQLRFVPGTALFNGLPFFGTTDSEVNVFSLSANYRWDDPKVAEAAPIVRKY